MRVAHILRKYELAEWGGTETALNNLTEGLAQHGVESLVYYPATPPKLVHSRQSYPQADPLVESGCKIRTFRAVVPIVGQSAEERRRSIAVGGNLLSFDLPRMLAREPGLSIVHTHTLGRLGGIGLTIARRRRIPFVVTVHGGVLDLPEAMKQTLHKPGRGLEWGRVFGWWWNARRVLTDADAIFTCNPNEAALLRDRYPGKRIVTRPHGVRTKAFRVDQRAIARNAYPEIANRTVLLCVGRIDPVKNQAWLVEQLSSVRDSHRNVLLVLAGASTNEAYHDTLVQLIAKHRLEDSVLLTGGLPPGDPRLVGLLQSADIAVLPSLSETFGLVILEAWAAGTPVIASSTSGATALIRNGENGWLFDVAKPQTFHAAVERTLAEPEHSRSMAALGRRIVETKYDTVQLAGTIRDLYEELIIQRKTVRHHSR